MVEEPYATWLLLRSAKVYCSFAVLLARAGTKYETSGLLRSVNSGVWFPDDLLASHLLHWRQFQCPVKQFCLPYSAQTIDEALRLIGTWCASKCRLSQSGGGAASRSALLSHGME
ncbi:unnamed protein product [Cercospora beticola]|nr:unnamed protein product [Cercospora beticola]